MIGPMRRYAEWLRCAAVTALALAIAAPHGASLVAAGAATCQPAGALVRIAALPEGSGVALSRRTPGRLWTHNDSGKPELIALDTNGAVVGRIQVTGAKVEDWEAVATGPCDGGSCIYIGDIGDNDAERRSITIYRIVEPAEASGSAAVVDVMRLVYPDGAHDAEALLVTPKGDILIVTKGDTGPVALYRVPSGAKPGATITLQAVGQPRQVGKVGVADRVTDGDISPNGASVALRSRTAVVVYRTADLMAGAWKESARIPLTSLGEPQGEGIAFGEDGALYLVGEGGGKSKPGTFARLTCAF